MISVGDKIYLNGIITKQNENSLSDIWALYPAKGEIDSNAAKLERPTKSVRLGWIAALENFHHLSFAKFTKWNFQWWKFQSITMDNYDDKRRTLRAASIRDSA